MDIIIIGALLMSLTTSATACQSRAAKSSNPVLEFRPSPADGTHLIMYNSKDKTALEFWKNKLDQFLEPYYQQGFSENVVECNGTEQPPKDKVCDLKIAPNFGRCTAERRLSGGICILLTLTQLPQGWLPQWYNSTHFPRNLPTEMPQYLKKLIIEEEDHERHQKVWVSCEGENPADIENLGPVDYYPSAGFQANHFFNRNVKGYLSPVIAVCFPRPLLGVLINVRCTAWASNIRRDPKSNLGSLHLELLIDEK